MAGDNGEWGRPGRGEVVGTGGAGEGFGKSQGGEFEGAGNMDGEDCLCGKEEGRKGKRALG